MTILKAAKILAKYPHRTRERPNTCYGGTSNVYECSCCRRILNHSWNPEQEHEEGCELADAIRVIGEASEPEEAP